MRIFHFDDGGADKIVFFRAWRSGRTSQGPQPFPLKTVVILCCMHNILALHGAFESRALHAPLGVWAMGVQSVYAMLPRHGSMWTEDHRNIVDDRLYSDDESCWECEWKWEDRSAPSGQHDGKFEDDYGAWSDNAYGADNGGYERGARGAGRVVEG